MADVKQVWTEGKEALGEIRKGVSLGKLAIGAVKTVGAMLKNPKLIPKHLKEVSWVSLKNTVTGEQVGLVWSPATVSVNDESAVQSYDIIERGEVIHPRGMKLQRISWDGTLPGKRTYSTDTGGASDLLNDLTKGKAEEAIGGALSWVSPFKWDKPLNIATKLRRWQKSGDILHLTITHTGIDLDLYLVEFQVTHQGGAGDLAYSIKLVKAEPLLVGTQEQTKASDPVPLNERKEAPPPDTATVKEGDTMWEMAQRQYGDGAQWTKIAEANPGVDPECMQVGTTLKIPH